MKTWVVEPWLKLLKCNFRLKVKHWLSTHVNTNLVSCRWEMNCAMYFKSATHPFLNVEQFPGSKEGARSSFYKQHGEDGVPRRRLHSSFQNSRKMDIAWDHFWCFMMMAKYQLKLINLPLLSLKGVRPTFRTDSHLASAEAQKEGRKM